MYSSTNYNNYSNLGFNIRPRIKRERLKGLDYNQEVAAGHKLFLDGVYHYANSDRDEISRKRSVNIFGEGTIPVSDKENSAFFLGAATLRHYGIADTPYEYWLRQKKEVPSDIKTEEDAFIHIGKQLLGEMRGIYDRNAKLTKDTQNNVDRLLGGEIKPDNLTEKELSDITEAGYSINDIMAANHALELTKRSVWDKLAESGANYAKAMGENIVGAFRTIGELAEEDTDTTLLDAATGYVKRSAEVMQAPLRPFTGNIEATDFLREYEGDKQAVLSLIGMKLAKDAEQEYEAGDTGDHLTKALEMEINSLAETAANLMPENQPKTASWKRSSKEMGQRADYLTFIRDSINEGRNAAKAKRESISAIEGAGEFGIGMLPYVVPGVNVLASVRVANEGYGRALKALQDEDGELPDLFSSYGMQAFGKGMSQGLIDAGVNGLSLRAVGKTFSRLAPEASSKWGAKLMSRYAAAYGAEVGMNTLNFAVLLPMMEGGANLLYDTLAQHDPDLNTGLQTLQQGWDDLQRLDYWRDMSLASAVFGLGGAVHTRHNARLSSKLNDSFRVKGLDEKAITEAQKIGDLKERAESMQNAFAEQKQKDPAGTLEKALDGTKKVLDKAKQEQAQKRFTENASDEAFQATMQLHGVSYENSGEPGKVDIYTGGKYDETTGKYEKGTTKITIDTADAELYLGSLFDSSFEALAHKVRDTYGSDKLLEKLNEIYGDKLKLEAIVSPEMLDVAVKRAKEAEQKVNERVKQLIDSTKSEDGKPTISETEARKRALSEVDGSLHKKFTLGELIQFGKNIQDRADIEKAHSRKDQSKMPISSRAFVFNLAKKAGDTVRRVLRYTRDASTREIAEEYGEMFMEDYMNENKASYTDTWRTLQDLQAALGKDAPFATTLDKNYSNLAERVKNGAQDANFDASELDKIRRDVREAMSLLMFSDLRGKSSRGEVTLPEWARPLFTASLLSQSRMQQEMALATAINLASKNGLLSEAASRLLGVQTGAVERILSEIEKPTVNTYYETFQNWNQRFANLALLDGLTLEDLEAREAEYQKASQQYQAELEQQEGEKHKGFDLSVKELEEKGLSHEESVKKANDNIIEAKEEQTAENPYVQKDDAFANGQCVEVIGNDGTSYYSGVVSIDKLNLMPNFKQGSNPTTGEVNPLTGDYKADHDPVRVFQAKDGTLTVISGRHRLAHAKRSGATKIAAYVYKESDTINMKWAQQRDIEWNIRDNQATPLEVALYIRGELIDGVAPLNDIQMEQIGIKRSGSLASLGYTIGTRGSDAVIMALRNGQIDVDSAVAICQFSSNAQVQAAGVRAAANDEGKGAIRTSMGIESGRLEMMEVLGLQDTADLFGELMPNAGFQAFVDKYAKAKLYDLGQRRTFLNATTRKKSDTFAKEYEAVFNNPSLLKSEKAKVAELIAKWQSPYLHPELREELQDAYKKADLEGWQAAEAQAKQKAADRPAEEGLPLFKEGNYDDTTANFSIISDHLTSWERNPEAELGELGRFGDNLQGKLQPIGEKFYDQRVANMITALKRRQRELQHIKEGSTDDAQKIFGEMQAIVNQLTNMLPKGYRFGLEPYLEFLTVYADLYGTGEAGRAGATLPMAGWQEIMGRSFEKHFWRMLTGNMSEREQSEFSALYNDFIAESDISNLRNQIYEARTKAEEDVRNSNEKLVAAANKGDLKSQAKLDALIHVAKELATDEVIEDNADIVKTMYRAIGEMRANRLMDKFLARVIKKLDNNRKDRILASIIRATNGLTPRKEKNGKPVHGRVEKDVYDKTRDYMSLMLLTKSEKELVDQMLADSPNVKHDTEIEVNTYDSEGAEKTIKCTLNEYNTYACYEAMTAQEAEAAAASLGTFIKHGKEAWKVAEQQANEKLNGFCAPMMEKWGETTAQKKKRMEKHSILAWTKNKILNALADWFNDAQLFDLCGSIDGFSNLKALTKNIADAHTYMETAERDNVEHAYNSLDSILKLEGKSKRERDKAKRDFQTRINKNKDCNITLNTQPPDFEAQHKAILRRSLLKRLNSISRQKNFSRNKMAAAVKFMLESDLMPKDIANEVYQKYGRIGDASQYKKSGQFAFMDYFNTEKFAHLLDINTTIQERTAKSLDEWNNGKFDKDGNMVKEPAKKRQEAITEITPNQAAYRVLMTEQADYADMLRRQGYTPEVVAQLREIAGDEMMEYAYALRERMNARTGTMKAIYENIFGMPFPQVDNYFRAYFDASNKTTKDATLTDLNLGLGAGEGSIDVFHTRVKHNASIMPTMNVTTAYFLGTKQQDTIIAYANKDGIQHLGLFLNKVFSHKQDGMKMEDVFKNGLGNDAYGALKRQTENMLRIFGSIDEAAETMTRLMNDVGSASAVSILNGRFSSLLKNSMAYFNTLGGSDKVGSLEWYSSMLRVETKNAKITPEQILKEPVIRDRFKGWDFDANKKALHNLTEQETGYGATDASNMYGMAAFGAIDRSMTARSAAILYDAVYRKLERENKDMTHDALHALCMDEVAHALGMKGQPLDFRQRALNASRVDWRTLGSYFLGGESWNTFTNCMRLWAKSNIHTQEGKENLYRAASVWLTQGTAMALLNWGYYWLTDDEAHWEKRNFMLHMAFGAFLGPVNGMPIISNLIAGGVTTIGRMSGYRDMPYFGTPGFFPAMDVFRVVPQLQKAFVKEDMNWWDKAIAANDAVRAATFIAMATNARPTTKSKARILGTSIMLAGISNGIDFALRLGRAADERHFNSKPKTKKKKKRKD